MKSMKKRQPYSARPVRRYPYPNAADRSYFEEKILDGITAVVTCMGTITLFFYFLTM